MGARELVSERKRAMNSIAPASNAAIAYRLTALSDDGLLERMQNDDEGAFRALVERHIDRAFGLALGVLKNAADAEDVVQEAVVKAWLNRHAWQFGRAKFSTWLYRVIVNRCIDLRRRPRGEDIDEVPDQADEADDAIAVIHKREVFGRLDAAMARLPEQQRMAVLLSYYDECSNGEIAEIMGTTVNAVESLLKRGRQRLRDILQRSMRDCGHAVAGP